MKRSVKYLVLLSIFAGFSALAQDSTTPAAPPPAAPPKAAKPLSVEEMRTESAAHMAKVEEAMRYLLHLKEQAKKQKDLIKLNCINDKLIKMKAQVNLTESTNDELQGALTDNNEERFAIYARLSTDVAAVETIKEEGQACIGESELYKQESGVTVDRPDIVDDPNQDPFFDVVEPPGYASPFN